MYDHALAQQPLPQRSSNLDHPYYISSVADICPRVEKIIYRNTPILHSLPQNYPWGGGHEIYNSVHYSCYKPNSLKMHEPFIRTNLNLLYPRMLRAKFSWTWPKTFKFLLLHSCFSLEKGVAGLHLNKLESPVVPKDDLYILLEYKGVRGCTCIQLPPSPMQMATVQSLMVCKRLSFLIYV